MKTNTQKLSRTAELALFGMLGALMFVLKVVMAPLPNIHPVGVLLMTYTVVFRRKALVPLYVYVFLELFESGLSPYWVPNLYVWAVLWAATMLLPKRMPPAVAAPVYMVVCGLHGLCYGTLWAPAHALLFHLDVRGMLAWIAAGFPFDVTHAIGNFLLGSLILPLSLALKKAVKQA